MSFKRTFMTSGRISDLNLPIIVGLICGVCVWAQVGANVGGVVRDTSGAVIPGATVTITNTSNGVSQTLKTGAEGNYRAVNLQPAAYQITAEASGFGTAKKSVTLLVGSDVAVDFSLGLAGVSESVTVTGEAAALVETTKSAPTSVINDHQLAELPVLNRNFLVVAQTMPGATTTTNLNIVSGRFSVTKVGGVADQASGYTTIIDGAPIDDPVWGTPIINMSQDAIQEFTVFRNQFDAQYGHAENAVVNVVSKSGGDQFHGTAYYFGRDAALNARNALASTTPPYSLDRLGATFGGPLIGKNTYFFASYEYLDVHTAFIEALPARNPFAAQENGNYPFKQIEPMGDFKVDHNFSDSNRLWVRYAYDHQISPRGGPPNASATQSDNSISHSLVAEDNWIVSPDKVNTFRYTYLYHDLFTLPSNYNVTLVYPDFSFGENNVDPQYFIQNNHTFADTFFINKAKHDIKIGAEATRAVNEYEANFYRAGYFTFTTDVPFDINNPATWPQSFIQQTPGNFWHHSWDLGAFIQDDWRILPQLRLNLGLRYDFSTNLRDNRFYTSLLNNPQFAGINNFISPSRGTEYDGLQPRLGFAWDVTGKGNLVVRGGFGRYLTRMRPYWDEAAEEQTFGASVRITNPAQLQHYPDITAVLNGQSLASYVASGGPRSLVLIPNNFRLPYSMNFTGGIGWKVNSQSSLNLDYVHDHDLDDVGTTDANLPLTGAVNASNPRPFPKFTQVSQIVNNGQAWYDALEIQYRSRVKGFDSIVVSYTYSKSIINGVTWYSTYSGVDRFRDNYAYNPTHTPSNLSVNFATIMLPGRFQLSGVFSAVSGPPLGPLGAGFDLDGDGNITNDRPRGLPQTVGYGDVGGQFALINAFRANPCSFTFFSNVPCTAKAVAPIDRSLLNTHPVVDLDLRLTKAFQFGERRRLEAFFEGYNVLNHVTLYGGNNTLTSPAFLIPTAALPARQLQWGARFTF